MTRLEQLVTDSRRLSVRTKESYLAGVRSFLKHAGEDEARWTPVIAEEWVKAEIARGLAPQTVNQALSGLRWAAYRRSEMDGATNFARPVEPFPVERKVNPQRALSVDEVRQLLAVVPEDGSRVERRDRVIVMLGLRAALRRKEIVQARWSTIKSGKMPFIGKGGRERTAFLDAEVQRALEAYRTVAPAGVDAVLVRADLGTQARADAKPLSPDGVYKILCRRATEAGIADLTPHTLRHTCATLLEAAGVPPHLIQQHLGHRGGGRGEMNSVTAGYVHHDKPISAALVIQ